MQRSFESTKWDLFFSITGLFIVLIISQLSYAELQCVIKAFFWGCAIAGMTALLTRTIRATEKDLLEYNVNQVAFLCSFGVYLFPLVIRKEKKIILKALEIFALIIMAISIVQSASKKAFFIDLLFLAMLWLSIHSFHNLSSRKIIFAILAALLFFATYHIFLKDSIMFDRIQALYENYDANADLAEKYEGRGRFYVYGWEMFSNNPWGYGFNSYTEYSGDFLQAHSDYICVLVDSGFFGFLCYWGAYLYIILHLFMKAWKSRERQDVEIEVFLFGVICICLFALGRWNYQSLETYLFLGLSWGMVKCKSYEYTNSNSSIGQLYPE